MKIINDENGVTLVELLIAILLFGLISMAVLNMYRAAMMNWNKTTSQSQFTNNTLNTIRYLNTDIHEASKLIQVKKKLIVLAKGKKKIKYSIKTTKKNIQIIREKLLENSKWKQDPMFPVADFGIKGPADTPTISFKKLSPQQIHVEISLPGSKFETTITKRSVL